MTFTDHFGVADTVVEDDSPKLIPLKDLTFPELVDNTMLSSFAGCPRYSYWAHFQHISPRTTSIHLHAGAAFAAAMESYRIAYAEAQCADAHEHAQMVGLLTLIKEYGSNPEVENDPAWADSAKSFEGMACAFIHTTTNWCADHDRLQPIMLNGKPAVELSFAESLHAKHPVTDDPLLFHGRFDMLGQLGEGGSVFVEDDKTTSALGATWAGQWDMRSQFTGYCWGAKAFGVGVAGAIVRGTAILKTKITHAEAIVYRPDWMIEEWYQDVHYIIQRMIDAWRTGYFPKLGAFNDKCSAYGGCPYKALCTSKDPEPWLSNYKRRVWNPANPSDEGDE